MRRHSLLSGLDGFLERRLTVLRAPAGFRKTTALADVAQGAKDQGLIAAGSPGLLLKLAPRNLHVAMAFRSDPGLNLALHMLDDRIDGPFRR